MRHKKISPSPVFSFFKYAFLLIVIISSGVFVTTGKPLKLVGEALQTIMGSAEEHRMSTFNR